MTELTYAQGPHTHHARWKRERDRSPAIKAIPVGTILARVYKDVVHVVRCLEGCWLYAGARYPTLYKVVEQIVGAQERPRAGGGTRRTSNYSAPHFFGLVKYDRRRRSSARRTPTRTKVAPKKEKSTVRKVSATRRPRPRA